ncbi:hypothetical protein [Lysinibacillus capsici]|uniref:hypothetical protein n=1 Tax=Lysinibacillus capsici TaxID=2115968 RepID=UPI0012D783CD|nr:hypothetical protein [Lysinibacillus sphaericus]
MSEKRLIGRPGKDAGGTEINLSPCKVAFSAVDTIFFNQKESPMNIEKFIGLFC